MTYYDYAYDDRADEAWDARYDDRPATESEAHAEWHWNAGVPMGTGACPWDACGHDKGPEDYEDPTDAAPVVQYVPALPLPDFDPDDVPF